MRKNIYGIMEDVKGAILLTNKNTGSQKYFIVTAIAETYVNVMFFPDKVGINRIRVATDAHISQKQAATMKQLKADGLELPTNWTYEQ